MSKAIDKGYNPVISGTFDLDDLGYATNFAIQSNRAGEATITNMNCPVAYPETVRFSAADVRNVYKDSGVDPNLYAASARGRSVVVSIKDTWKEFDTEDATYEVALPMKAHLVVTVPNVATITDADIERFVARLCSCAFTGASGTPSRLMELLKGSMLPQGL